MTNTKVSNNSSDKEPIINKAIKSERENKATQNKKVSSETKKNHKLIGDITNEIFSELIQLKKLKN